MIPGSIEILHSERGSTVDNQQNWQQLMAGGPQDPRQLLSLLQLEPEQVPQLDPGALDFPLRVPLAFVQRMEPGNPADPLLLQVLPSIAEKLRQPGFTTDPLHEAEATAAPGIIHKYAGRVLLIATGACAVHCRYCFRRHFPYQEHLQSRSEWEQNLAYIRTDESIEEVILSGGDPLSLGNGRLESLLKLLEEIPHLKRLRIHTRQPVVLPQRVDQGLLQILEATTLRKVMVIHCNHPSELDHSVHDALTRLANTGITLLNQAVLLKGVNDNPDCLTHLSQRLFDMGVLPYYLHLLDPVAGSAHFDVTEFTAREIYRSLLERLPGYLVPKLVRENPAFRYKTPIPNP